MPLSSTLLALHDIIQIAVGWTDSHLFEFVIGDRVYGEPMPDDDFWDRHVYKAAGIRPKTLIDRGVERFLYVYDFGDDWRHDIFIELCELFPAAPLHPTRRPALADRDSVSFVHFLECARRAGRSHANAWSSRIEPDPTRELPPAPECMDVTDGADQRSRRQRFDTGHRLQARADRVGRGQVRQLAIDTGDPHLQCSDLLLHAGQHLP